MESLSGIHYRRKRYHVSLSSSVLAALGINETAVHLLLQSRDLALENLPWLRD